MIETKQQAKTWISNQPCGPDKRKRFMQQWEESCYTTKLKIQDYIDGLRRDYYNGMGI